MDYSVPAKPPLVVIINIDAEKVKALSPVILRDRLRALFAAQALETEFHLISSKKLSDVLNELRHREVNTVIGVGGDGTLRTVASSLAGTSIALGILPLGTFNHFARALGIPLTIDEAVKVIAKGARISVDVAEVNGAVFINNASVGFYARAVRLRERLRRRLRLSKLLAMAYALLAVLWRLPKLDLRLSYLPGGVEVVRAPFVFVGNNLYVSRPLSLVRERGVAQGCLSVLFTPDVDRKGLVTMAAKTLVWPIRRNAALKERQVKGLVISSSKRRLHVALDGEIMVLRPPLVFRTWPQALQVIRFKSPASKRENNRCG